MMDDKIVIQLTRPVKVAKDTCVACGAKQWKCFTSIHSARSKNIGLPNLLQLYCHVSITRGGICYPCGQTLRKLNRKIEQFRSTCHETLIENRILNKENLVRTGIQEKNNYNSKNIMWPGKENLFVALSVCSNLPSALHHTITTENLSQTPDGQSIEDSQSLCLKEHNYVKDSQRICIKAECLAKPALVPFTNQRTPLPLARLAAMKIGGVMGTGLLGSATMCRQASPLKKEVTESSDKFTSQTNKKTDTNLRCTSVNEILQEADWLYRNDHETPDTKRTTSETLKRKGDDKVNAAQGKNNSGHKRLKSKNNNPSPKNTKDIIYWESEWKNKNASVYYMCSNENCSEMLLGFERSVHMTTHRPNMKGFCCPECDVQYEKWATMLEHLRCSHFMATQMYKCDQLGCDKVYLSFKNLRRHMLYEHNFESALESDNFAKHVFDKVLEADVVDDLPSTLCSVCGIACKSKDLDVHKAKHYTCKTRDLDVHKAKHYVPECLLIHCTACNLVFTDQQIKDHVLSMHRKLTYLYRCKTCDFSSQTSAGLQRHMGIKHTNAVLLVCDKCGKGFKTTAALNVHHKRVHVTEDQKTVLCSTCGYLCAHETLLKEHIRKVHIKPSWRRFKCPQCNHFSLRESSLEHHIQMYHSQSEERQFKCSYCPYASKTKANLVRHELTHKGLTTPFLCPNCDFTGANKEIVEEHILAKHTKEMPYSCTICGKFFSYQSNLASHMDHFHRANSDNQNTERIVADEQQDRLYFQL